MHQTTLLLILINTPRWVFALLGILLYLGWQQSQDREIRRQRLFIMPLLMAIFSFISLQHDVGLSWLLVISWLIPYVLMISLAGRWVGPRQASYRPAGDCVALPGSWLPLGMMLGLFLLKYLVGYAEATQAELTDKVGFPYLVSALFGLLAGLFAARSRHIYRLIAPAIAEYKPARHR